MDEKKRLISCGKCHQWFRVEDIVVKKRKLYGIEINENCCPHCGHIGFTARRHELFFEKYEQTNDI